MKWWGWLVAGVAATVIFVGLLTMLDGLDVLNLSKSGFIAVFIGGLLIIWATCIAVAAGVEGHQAHEREVKWHASRSHRPPKGASLRSRTEA